MIFTDYTVKLTNNYIIINKEIFISKDKGGRAITKKCIYNGNLEIYYSDEWDYCKSTGIMSLKKDNIKKLIIPIPKREYKNAERYIDSPI